MGDRVFEPREINSRTRILDTGQLHFEVPFEFFQVYVRLVWCVRLMALRDCMLERLFLVRSAETYMSWMMIDRVLEPPREVLGYQTRISEMRVPGD